MKACKVLGTLLVLQLTFLFARAGVEFKACGTVNLNLPDAAGLVGLYTTDSFDAGANQWKDLSGSGNHVTTVAGTVSVNKPAGKAFYISGNTQTSLIFPSAILPPTFTLFTIARYNGGTKGRIFNGVRSNWLSGFWNSRSGVAHHTGWNTHYEDKHGSAWVMGTSWNNGYRSNGVDRTTNGGPSGSDQLAINARVGCCGGEVSDFAIQMIVVYNRKLDNNEIGSVENILKQAQTCGPIVNKFDFNACGNVKMSLPNKITGLVALYSADSFDKSSNTWKDVSGLGNDVTAIGGTIKVQKTDGKPAYISGSTGESIKFPGEILPAQFTLFTVARYNGGTKGRIFQGVQRNWLSGFWAGRSGVAHHTGWNTKYEDKHGSAWVQSTSWGNGYRSNGVDRTTGGPHSSDQLAINTGALGNEKSDFAIQFVIVYDRKLNDGEILQIEKLLKGAMTCGPVVTKHEFSACGDMGLKLPEYNGLVGMYSADSFDAGANKWNDISGSKNDVTDMANISIEKTKGKPNYISGNPNSKIVFPAEILPDQFTLFTVARYSGATKGRIFQGVRSNWLSGFWSGRAGVAHHNGWNTKYDDLHGSSWVLGTSWRNGYRSNGIDRTNNEGPNSSDQLAINAGAFGGEKSDFQIQYVVVYDRKLDSTEMIGVETVLNTAMTCGGSLLPRFNANIQQYIFSSGVWDNNAPGTGHARIQIDSPQAWSSPQRDKGEVILNLGKVIPVAGVVSQGRHDCCQQWVTAYDLSVSSDKATWKALGRFQGNNDADSLVYNKFPAVESAQYVKVTVVSVHNHASMRFDALLPLGADRFHRFYSPMAAYEFPTGIWDGNAPGTGHARPQIGSAQAWSNSKLQGGSITIDIGKVMPVAGVATQGRANQDQWVSEFEISVSSDKSNWKPMGKFPGNIDRNTIVNTVFPEPVVTRWVKLTVLGSKWHSSLRWDVLLPGGDPFTVARTSISKYMFISGVWDNNAPGINHARPQIDSPQAWSNSRNTGGIIAINLGSSKSVSGVVTQGRHNSDQRVTSFDIDVSSDNATWKSMGRFNGNADADARVFSVFPAPVNAQYVRLTVQASNVHSSLRWDVLLTKAAAPTNAPAPTPALKGKNTSVEKSPTPAPTPAPTPKLSPVQKEVAKVKAALKDEPPAVVAAAVRAAAVATGASKEEVKALSGDGSAAKVAFMPEGAVADACGCNGRGKCIKKTMKCVCTWEWMGDKCTHPSQALVDRQDEVKKVNLLVGALSLLSKKVEQIVQTEGKLAVEKIVTKATTAQLNTFCEDSAEREFDEAMKRKDWYGARKAAELTKTCNIRVYMRLTKALSRAKLMNQALPVAGATIQTMPVAKMHADAYRTIDVSKAIPISETTVWESNQGMKKWDKIHESFNREFGDAV